MEIDQWLCGWRDIGSYIKKSARTAQRYARDGMPFFRDPGGRPMAQKSQIDEYIRDLNQTKHDDKSWLEVVKVCLSVLSLWDPDGCEKWKDGDTKIFIQMESNILHEEINKISRSFPDDVIYCYYGYQSERYSEGHVTIYRNGEHKQVVNLFYHNRRIFLNNDEDQEGIYKKAEDFFRRIDTTVTDKEGNMVIEWFPEEVCYMFDYNGVDRKKFKVWAKKCRDRIDYMVLEGLIKYDWREISGSPEVDYEGFFLSRAEN